jgi:undecaprenyl-diphosphatase
MSLRSFVPFRESLRQWWKEPLVPFSLLLIACGLLAFIGLAEAIEDKKSHSYDERILLAMREAGNPSDPLGPPWMEELGRDITALGGFTILTGLTLAAIGLMLLYGRPKLAGLTLVAITGGMQVSAWLKNLFDRPRPDLVPHFVHVSSASFPSGHAMMAAVVYLTLGVMLARTQTNRSVRLYLVSLSVIITLLVGCSRVYLGVHWPTDVLAGWMLGGAWAVTFGLIALKVDPRRVGDEGSGKVSEEGK